MLREPLLLPLEQLLARGLLLAAPLRLLLPLKQVLPVLLPEKVEDTVAQPLEDQEAVTQLEEEGSLLGLT
jgi:hypothetical protein